MGQLSVGSRVAARCALALGRAGGVQPSHIAIRPNEVLVYLAMEKLT